MVLHLQFIDALESTTKAETTPEGLLKVRPLLGLLRALAGNGGGGGSLASDTSIDNKYIAIM